MEINVFKYKKKNKDNIEHSWRKRNLAKAKGIKELNKRFSKWNIILFL